MLIVIICATLGFHRFTNWNAEVESSVWVAIGTIALAGVTTWSVLQTQAVIASEDKRLQQSLAPYLTATLVFSNEDEEFETAIVGVVLRNSGQGMASTVHIVLSAYFAEFIENDDDARATLAAFKEQGKRPFFRTSYVDAIAEKEQQTARFWDDDWDGRYPSASGTLIEAIEISYQDMFGNPYKTVYEWYPVAHHWVRPEALRAMTPSHGRNASPTASC